MYFVLTLAVSGLLLIYLEFFLPGAVMAIGGSLLLLVSLFFFHMQDLGILSFAAYIASLACSIFLIIKLALWQLKASAKRGTMRLESDQEGFLASSYPSDLVGKTAIAETDLKPSGHVLIEGLRYQAMSKSGYIDKAARLKVTGGTGSHLLVQHSENAD